MNKFAYCRRFPSTLKSGNMASIYGLMVCVLIALKSCESANPGIILRVTNTGLQYADKIAIEKLVQAIRKASIPDVQGDADTPVGHISYDLSSIKITSASIPSSSFKTVPNVGLQLEGSGISVSLHGDWHYREDHWPHISDSGSFDLSGSGIRFSITAKMGVDSTGHPTISSAGCSADIGNIDITFHGGASWLYNLFSSYIGDKIKDAIKGVMCSEATKAINVDAAKALASFPVKKQLDANVQINYELMGNPTFTDTYLDIGIKGEFQTVKNATEAPFQPAPIPTSSKASRMAYIWITDYVANTAGLIYTKVGVLKYNVTPSMVPKSSPFQLNTTSFKVVIPQLYKLYPDQLMELELNETNPPVLSSDSSGITLTATGNMLTYVLFKNGSRAFVFTLGLEVTSKVTLSVKYGNITGHADYVSAKVSVVKSSIGDIKGSIALLQIGIDYLCKNGIIKTINKYFEKGYPLPIVENVEIVNPVITISKNLIEVASDFSYVPNLEEVRRYDQMRYEIVKERDSSNSKTQLYSNELITVA